MGGGRCAAPPRCGCGAVARWSCTGFWAIFRTQSARVAVFGVPLSMLDVGATVRLRGMSVLDDFGFETISKAVFFHFQIVSGLKVEPEPLACTEEPGKPQSRIRGDIPLAMNHFVDAPRRDIDAL